MQWFRFAKHGSKPIEELFITDKNYSTWVLKQFQLSVKEIRGWIGFALLCSLIGPENSRQNKNHDLVARILPLFWLFRCFNFWGFIGS